MERNKVIIERINSCGDAFTTESFEADFKLRNDNFESHQHNKGQLLFVQYGAATCEVDGSIWLVPINTALWIPEKTPHTVVGTRTVKCICIYVKNPTFQNATSVFSIQVSSLLQELIKSLSLFPENTEMEAVKNRMFEVFKDQINLAPSNHLTLNIPTDARLVKLMEGILTYPEEKSLSHWASHLCMSERNLTRIIKLKTGLNFVAWRRKIHIIMAINRLSSGMDVSTVAYSLGYENASSFVTMFKSEMNLSPQKYIRSNGS